MSVCEFATKRILKEFISFKKDPLETNGIYVHWDEDNINELKACIVGPTDTPYAYGYYLFKIKLCKRYPTVPPSVFYCSPRDVRMHPNLYTQGKVCLSILNTWSGPSWSMVLTVRSVLLTIQSLLSKEALKCEPMYGPGLESQRDKIRSYDESIAYYNLKDSIFDVYESIVKEKNSNYGDYRVFKDVINDNLKKNYDDIRFNIQNIKTTRYTMYNNKKTTIDDKTKLLNYLNKICFEENT
tara:strand:+ start:93 stop:812 length:720 start_codon:yes stop_codon:yes gene_type:complete